MGANRTQAVGLTAFLLGFTFLSGALYAGKVIFVLLGIALLVVSVVAFQRAKPLEYLEN